MIIKNGVPAVTAAGSADLGAAVTQTTPGALSVSAIVANILSNYADGAVIVIDPHTGKVYASSDSTKAQALRDAAIAGTADVCHIVPDAAQTGRSLSFSIDEDLIGLTGVNAIQTAVKPKFTVESLVNKLLSLQAEFEAATPANAGKQLIVIDQVNKSVDAVLSATPSTARTALDAVDLSAAGENVKVTLTPESVEASGALPFEGGTV